MNESNLDKKGERKEKKINGLESEFLLFPFSIFLFLSCSFHVYILLYLRLYKIYKLYYSNFRIFLSRPSRLQWSTLLSASLRRLFRNLWLKLKRINRTFGKSSFGAVTNIRFGLTNIRWANKTVCLRRSATVKRRIRRSPEDPCQRTV